MMKQLIVICLLAGLIGCGGSLSDKQRKALKKEMERREIKKVSEQEIFNKALSIGHNLTSQLKQGKIDSIARANGVRIFLADSLSKGSSSTHREILEAYRSSPDKKDLRENVQNSGDTIIYSAPVLKKGQLQGVWFINIPRKKIVLAI